MYVANPLSPKTELVKHHERIVILTLDSTTGYYDIYAPIYYWDEYVFNADGDAVHEELRIPYTFII